jgi:NAD(P)-dependent dehydrogenase (short-subunit alcohol dehydrogenase family)
MSHRAVLITGVSTGIGKATAQYLMNKGYPVIGSVRKEEDAAQLSAEYPNLFHTVIFDVRNEEQIQSAVRIVEKITNGEGLGALINNAGVAVSGPMQYVKSEYMRYQMDVNVHGLISVTQSFLPLLGAQNGSPYPPGRLINVSSVSGRLTRMMMGPYSASKYAVEALSDAWRRELSLFGIKVVIIEPGPIDTEIWEKARSEEQPYMDTEYGFILEQREKIIKQNEEMAISAHKVAQSIYSGLTKKRPKTRYLVTGKKILIQSIIKYFPDRWVDYLFTMPMRKANKK